MSTVTCPRCGASNVANARYCITCGTPLVTPPVMPQQATPPPPPTPQQYYSYTASYWEVQRSGKINNTKTGLLLLMIGSFISWVPFVNFVGGIIILIGAILVIVGREAFGHEHDRNVIIAIIIFVVGIGVAIVVFFVALLTAVSTAATGAGFATGQPTIFSLIGVIAGAVFGIAEVIFTYALQNNNGRILLWSAYILSIVLGLVNAIVIQPLITTTGGLAFFTSGLFLVSDLLVLPAALIFGLAFFMAYQRVVHGEIPSRPTHQSATTWSAGYMPPSQ